VSLFAMPEDITRTYDWTFTRLQQQQQPQQEKGLDAELSKCLHRALFFKDTAKEILNSVAHGDPVVEAEDEHGELPLNFAASRDLVEVMKLPIAKGARVQRLNPFNTSALHSAASERAYGAVHFLLSIDEGKTLIEQENNGGYSPLMIAVMRQHTCHEVTGGSSVQRERTFNVLLMARPSS
jgi:ankyrin repeat protein